MRPLELTLEGFRSYRDTAMFSFENRDLFGIVGPTGAGKSSLLDAMVYALYGKTPKLERETRRLINTSCDEAKVKLTFDVDETIWEVTRVIRPKGNAPVVLRHFEQDRVEATGAHAVNDRIEQLLGLDFKAFCSTVTLPQGEFDRFLSAPASERARVLKGIFRLERVDALRDLVRERRAAAEAEVAAVEAALGSIPQDAEAQIGAGESQLLKLEKRTKEIREALPRESDIQRELEDAGRSLTELEEHRQSIEESLARIPVASDLETLAEEESRLIRAHENGIAAVKKAAEQLAAAEEESSRADQEFGGPALIEARDLIREIKRLQHEAARVDDELSIARNRLIADQQAAAKAELQVSAAEEAFKLADDELRVAHQEHAAHLLRKSLRDGEECPVCAQKVHKVPAARGVPVLDGIETRRGRAEKVLVVARKEFDSVRSSVSRSDERVNGLAKNLVGLKSTFGEVSKRIGEILGKARDPEAELTKRSELLEKCFRAVEACRKQLSRAQEEQKRAGAELEQTRKRRLSFTQILIAVCTGLEIDPPTFEDDSTVLVGAAKRAADECETRALKLEKSAAALRIQMESKTNALRELRESFGLQEGETAADALARASKEMSAVESRISQLKDALERRTQLSADREKLLVRRQQFDLLFSDLSDSKFPAYLLEEHRRVLSELGSEKLMALTGRYRFDDDGSFNIVDVMNDVKRSPDTLSGGETFLASLALALAMAEAVSSRGGRLDCFFLDEGFGSLDSASLDLALEGIEALAEPGRLIGLISHVGGIQTRLDDLIVLDRAEDGSTRVEQTEGPITYALTI